MAHVACALLDHVNKEPSQAGGTCPRAGPTRSMSWSTPPSKRHHDGCREVWDAWNRTKRAEHAFGRRLTSRTGTPGSSPPSRRPSASSGHVNSNALPRPWVSGCCRPARPRCRRDDGPCGTVPAGPGTARPRSGVPSRPAWIAAAAPPAPREVSGSGMSRVSGGLAVRWKCGGPGDVGGDDDGGADEVDGVAVQPEGAGNGFFV